MCCPSDPPEPRLQLFDAETLLAAGESSTESNIHWLGLSQDPEAANLRRTLEHCWRLAGHSREVLRKGLLHERWGQHAGALAHLLALGLFDHEGYEVTCEPTLGKQSPDMAIERDGFRALVEVRSITGRGETPWDRAPVVAQPLPPPRPASASGSGARQRKAAKAEARTRARKLAAQRAAARTAKADALSDVVVGVLEKKAAAYRELCVAEDLPYIICIYQDTDDQLSPLVADWAFGHGERHSTHDSTDGVFFSDRGHLGHVSGVVIFGRLDDEHGRLFLRGDVIVNPFAERPLRAQPLLPHLRTYRLHEGGEHTGTARTRMHWTAHVAPPFEIVPQP